MVLKVAKIVNNNVDSIFFTSESLENLKYILGDGEYVNIDGFSCRVGDTYKNGVIIPNFVGIPTSTTVSPTSSWCHGLPSPPLPSPVLEGVDSCLS